MWYILPFPQFLMPSSDDEFENWGVVDTTVPTTRSAMHAPSRPYTDSEGDTERVFTAPSSTAAAASAAPPSSATVRVFICGWRSVVLLGLCFVAMVGVAWVNPTLEWSAGSSSGGTTSGPGGLGGGAGRAKSLVFADPGQVFAGGALSPSNTPTPAPASGTGTPTPSGTGTTTQSAGASASGTPTPSGTASGTPTPTPTPTGTGTGSSTPSPTGTGSGTPTPTPTPSPTGTLGGGGPSPAECLALTTSWANATFTRGCAYDTCCYAFTLEVAHQAPFAACPRAAAEKLRASYAASLQPSDMCYLVISSSPGSASAVRASWGGLVQRIWYAVPPGTVQTGDRDIYPSLMPIAGAEGRPGAVYTSMVMHAMATWLSDPASASCKWLFVASDHTWVNPRTALATVRGLPHDGQPMQLGYIWSYMGFVNFVAGASGGIALWNRAALSRLQGKLMDPVLCPLTEDAWIHGPPYDANSPLVHPVNDLVALHSCALRLGIAAVNLNAMDASGALALNGVPLEPGPSAFIMGWLQADYNRGGHWVSVDNIGDGLIGAFFSSFKAVYGPLGVLGEYSRAALGSDPPPAPSPSPSDASFTAAYAPFPALAPPSTPLPLTMSTQDTPACAPEAYAALQARVAGGRDGETSGYPLPLELAAEVTAAACPAAHAPHVEESDVCLFVSRFRLRVTTYFIAKDAWGWRGKERLFIFGNEEDAELGVRVLPGAPHTPSQRTSAIIAAMWGAPETAACKWWAFVSDYDSVNPRSLAGLLRGLRWDVPTMVAFWWHGTVTGAVTTPALGRGLYSRAAVAVLAERLGTPACPKGCGGASSSVDDSADAAVCAWRSGIVPVHTFGSDVAGLGIMNDWAFQQEHYLLGWGFIINMGDNQFDSSEDAFPFKMALVETYFNKLYARAWNVSVAEYYNIQVDPYPGMKRRLSEHLAEIAAQRAARKVPSWMIGWQQ